MISTRMGLPATLMIGWALAAATPAVSATVDLSTSGESPTHLYYGDTGVADTHFGAGATLTSRYYLDFLFGQSPTDAKAAVTALNLVVTPFLDVTNYVVSLYKTSGAGQGLVATFTGTGNGVYAVRTGDTYRIDVSGTGAGNFGGESIVGIGLTSPVPGPGGYLVAIAGAGAIAYWRRRKSAASGAPAAAMA